MLVPLETARAAIDGAEFRPLRPVGVPPLRALGRLAAAPHVARNPLPAQTTAAMDGFALCVDPEAVTPLFRIRPVPGRARRGTGRLRPGEAVPIATGGVLPAGANTVVRVEATRTEDGRLYLREPAVVGQDTIAPGEVMARGDTILERGEPIGAVQVGALLAQQVRSVPTLRPRVTILPIGDEVVPAGHPTRGRVADFLSPIVASLLHFAAVRVVPPVPDDRAKVSRTLRRASRNADLVVTLGGSSVGPKDVTKAALGEVGQVLFEGVSVNVLKRGAVGFVGRTPTIVLPGQVVSAVVTFHEHALHVLSRMVGRELRRYEEVVLAEDVAVEHRMDSVYLFRVSAGLAGPLPWGVARMTALLRANAFGILERGRRYRTGERIVVQRLWSHDGSPGPSSLG